MAKRAEQRSTGVILRREIILKRTALIQGVLVALGLEVLSVMGNPSPRVLQVSGGLRHPSWGRRQPGARGKEKVMFARVLECEAKDGRGRKVVAVPERQTIFAQGDEADAVFYIQQGKVRLTVVSEIGKEATLGILSEGEFVGEGGLAGQSLRMGSAIAMTNCILLQIEKKAMMLALHREPTFSDLFIAYLLARNIRHEEDIVDQLFNSSEKRLARILLLLAHFGEEGVPGAVIPKISQEILAEMVGTTRPRVNLFMNRFRTLGFVDYGGTGMQVHSSLLNVVLHD
jgi:CRP/FNR family cyclic AMP-dependent transcriptional regulator